MQQKSNIFMQEMWLTLSITKVCGSFSGCGCRDLKVGKGRARPSENKLVLMHAAPIFHLY
jgi:hypothetical protein